MIGRWGRVHTRVVLALVAGVGGIALLQMLVRAEDRRALVPSPPAPEPAVRPLLSLGVTLQPAPGLVHVVRSLAALPVDVAPVVQVLPDGTMALRRPPPPPTGPLAASTGPDGLVAVLLPRGPLAGLGHGSRGALLDLLGTWISERPVPAARLRFVDEAADPAELDYLLSWVP